MVFFHRRRDRRNQPERTGAPKEALTPPRTGRFSRFLLDLDARIDHTLFEMRVYLRTRYDDFSAFMDRFYVSGLKKFGVEMVSEGLTLGCVGAVALLALAVPAFRETTDEDWIKKSELAVVFLDRYGNKLGERGIRHNDSVQLDEMPDHLIKAVLATEDRRFYEHFGIDLPGTFRALTANVQAQGVVQGGSSITQQLAKNLFLSNERTLERKVKEAFLAIWLETRLTKREILKLYLDRAYLGGGAFGVDGAAQYYFEKSVRDVNLAEAAMLAGLFKAPARFAPHINLAAARSRASTVLDNLVEANFMTEGQVFGARRTPAKSVDRRNEGSPNYYLDWAYREIADTVDRKMAGKTTERVFVVRTGLDPNIQRAAEDSLEFESAAVRQGLPSVAGGDGDHGAERARARDGRRPRLQRKPVQPRARRAAPARLLVQAVRLHHCAHPGDEADGHFAGYTLLQRQLVPEELRGRLLGAGEHAERAHALDQHSRRAHR